MPIQFGNEFCFEENDLSHVSEVGDVSGDFFALFTDDVQIVEVRSDQTSSSSCTIIDLASDRSGTDISVVVSHTNASGQNAL